MFATDFRALPAAIYDPASYNAATGARQPFPDRLVPETRINSVARRLLDYYLPGSDYSQRPLNVFRQPKQTLLADQGGVKIDVPLGNAGLLAGQYMQESSDITLPGVHPLTGVYYTLRMNLAGLQWTSNPDPRTVNVLRAGFTRPYLFYGGIGEAGLQQKLGITGTADQNGVPSVSLNGFSGFGAPQSVIGNIDNNDQLQETLTVMRGRHEIAAGAMLGYVRTVQESANWNAGGTLLFRGVVTAQTALSAAGAPVPVAGTGSSFADFLLGLPASGTVTSMPRTHYRWTEVHPFLQDTWRLRRDLTLNLGLSWYLATPPDPSGNDRNYPHAFDFNTGRILYAALGDIRPQIFSADRNNFSPRAGLAWQPWLWRGEVIRAAGGWSLSVISTFASGVPVTVTAPNNTPSSLADFRADRFCDGRRELTSRRPCGNGLFWLAPSCLGAPSPGYFGKSGVYILPGPGAANIDMALQKEIALKESVRMAVRLETFHTPNHTQFSAVNSMLGDANCGQVVQARTPRQIQIGMKLLW